MAVMSDSKTRTPRLNIPAKAVIQHGNVFGRYCGRARDRDSTHVFVSDDGVPKSFTDAEIAQLSATYGQDGRPLLRFPSAAEMAVHESGKTVNWSSLFERASDKERQRTENLLLYVRAWEHAGRPRTSNDNLKQIIDRTVQLYGTSRISTDTLRRALARWDGDIDSLVARHHPKGNCTTRVDEDAWLKHQEFAFEAYFRPERPDVVAVHGAVETAFEKYNAKLPPNGKRLAPLSLSTTYKMLAAEGQFIADYTRLGARKAKREHRAVGKAPVELIANAIWEVDASPLPVIALDDDSLVPIGRATVTLLLDRATRAIPGFDVSWRPESLRSVADALRMAMLPKNTLLKQAGIQGEYPMMGKPSMIVADHASHTGLRAKKFKLMCDRLGCEPSNAPVFLPYCKGMIERMLRTYFFSVCHVVPGSTFSDIFERNKEAVPEKVAVCTISELTRLLLRFIVEVYHPRSHRGLKHAPNLTWRASVEQYGITPPPDVERLTAILSVPFERTIQAYGIEIMGLRYNSEGLMEIRQLPDRPERVTAIIDPDEVTRAWWVDPRDGHEKRLYLPEPDRNKYHGWTLAKYERIRAIQRNNPELLASDEAAQKSYREFVADMLKMAQNGGTKLRTKAIRAWEAMRKRARNMFKDDVADPEDVDGDLLGAVFGVGAQNVGAGQVPDARTSDDLEDSTQAEKTSPTETDGAVKPKRPRKPKPEPEVPPAMATDPAVAQPLESDRPQPADESAQADDDGDIESLTEMARRMAAESNKMGNNDV